MFQDRQDAGRQLAQRLQGRAWVQPLVLGIPRGGVVVGAEIAQALGAELDVVLARKLRAPWDPELAIGAIGEGGYEILRPGARWLPGVTDSYLAAERAEQLAVIEERRRRLCALRPPAPVAGRSVIGTDDGIATGATVRAALQVVRQQQPLTCVLAVPVAARDVLQRLQPLCDGIACVVAPAQLGSVGAYYRDFSQVEDDEVLRLLQAAWT